MTTSSQRPRLATAVRSNRWPGHAGFGALTSALALVTLSLGACGGSNDLTVAPTASAIAPTLSTVPAPLPSGRLPELARPKSYALDLRIDPAGDHLDGKVKIDIDVPKETSVFVLHGRDLVYKSAFVFASTEPMQAELESRASAASLGEKDELVVKLPSLVKGSIQLVIDFSAPYTNELVGAYKTVVGADSYVFTQFEAMSARRAFPSFDEPGFKVPFDLKISAPAGNIAISNAPEVSRENSPDGKWTTTTFARTKPLPTYLLSFAVGPLETIEAKDSKVPLRVVTVKGKSGLGQAALDATKSFIDIQEKYFDIPYPFEKLDLVAVPDFAAGAMENAGMITFREELILSNAQSPASSIRTIGIVISHELAHHWFGDLVTMSWWDDLWLNEGFATWMEAKTVDVWRKDFGTKEESVSDRTDALGIDARPSARPVRREIRSSGEAEDAFDAITYNKGAAVIEMLESWLGADVFRAGVQKYLKAHPYGNATARDLFQALGDVSGQDVVSVASTFLDRAGVPLVKVELDCKTDVNEPKVKLSQERLVIAPPSAKAVDHSKETWKIPVCIAVDGQKAPLCTVLDGTEGSISLGRASDGKSATCPAWVAPNVDEYGYYRWSLPADMFRTLAKANVSARTKYGVLDNAATLFQSGKLGADVLFDLIEAMKPNAGAKLSKADLLVTTKILGVLGDLNDGVIDDEQRPAFARFAGDTLIPIAKSVGWDGRASEGDDIRIFRRALFTGLVPIVDDAWFKAEGTKRALAILKDPKKTPVDNSTAALVIGARSGDQARFDQYVVLEKNAETPQFRPGTLLALGCFPDMNLLDKGLDLMLSADMRKQDAIYVARGANWFPGAAPELLKWIGRNDAAIAEKLPSFTRVGLASSLTICDPDLLAKAHATFDGKLDKIEGGAHALEELYERAEICIAERAREGAHITKRLKAH